MSPTCGIDFLLKIRRSDAISDRINVENCQKLKYSRKLFFLSVKMKLLTNENNVDALKIAIAANEANVSLEIIYQTDGLVPCLVEDKSDLKLFVANAACMFLHEESGILKEKKTINAIEGN